MARRHEAEQLLREGLCPPEISDRMGISWDSVIQYLRLRVGEGALRLSDLYFSYSPEKRKILQNVKQGEYPDGELLLANGMCFCDFELFQSLRNPRVFLGDLYEYVSTVEIALHRLVRKRLECEFGSNEDGWWRKGIPMSIRAKCASRREEDDEPSESAYAYTTLIDLKEIMSKSWRLFENQVPKELRDNLKQFERDLVRLNRIRNSVMHPVKEREWSEDDFVFVRQMCALFEPLAAS